MNRQLILLGAVAAILLSAAVVVAQSPAPPPALSVVSLGSSQPLGTAFTYQGQLKKNGLPFNGACSLTFSVWDSQSDAGGQLGSDQTFSGISMTNGLLTVQLNGNGEFGPDAFTGDARWLQIAVQCAGDSTAVTFPRQLLTAAPFALFALRAGKAITATTALTANLALTTTSASWGGLTGVPTGFADALDNDTLASLVCGGSGYLATWSGSAWACTAPVTTTYGAGYGLGLSNNQFSVVTGTIQARVSGSCAAGSTISAVAADGNVTCSAPRQSALFYPLGLPQTLDLAAIDGELVGFAGGFSDGRYDYFAPNSNGKLARLDPQNFVAGGVSTLNLTAVDPSLFGFVGGFTDGRYGYLVPNFNAKLARVDLQNFTGGGVTVLNLAGVDPSLSGFVGGFSDGRYGYLIPASNGKVARVDLLNFSTSGVTVLDLTGADAGLQAFQGGFSDGRYGYLIPNANSKVARVDLQNFTAAGVTALDLSAVDTALKAFQGGFSDGRYGYFAPNSNGKVARVDLQNFTASSVSVLDLSSVDSGLKGFRGGFTDGRFGYFVPGSNDSGLSGKAARVDLLNFTTGGVAFLDYAGLDVGLRGFWGGLADGRYGYLVPNNSGKVARLLLFFGGGF